MKSSASFPRYWCIQYDPFGPSAQRDQGLLQKEFEISEDKKSSKCCISVCCLTTVSNVPFIFSCRFTTRLPSLVKTTWSLQRAQLQKILPGYGMFTLPTFQQKVHLFLILFKNCWYAFGTSNEMSNKNENLQSEISIIMTRCWLNKKSPGNFFSYRRRQKSKW